MIFYNSDFSVEPFHVCEKRLLRWFYLLREAQTRKSWLQNFVMPPVCSTMICQKRLDMSDFIGASYNDISDKRVTLKKQEFWILLWNILALHLIFIKVSATLYWLLMSIPNTFIIYIFNFFNFFMCLSDSRDRDLVLQDKLAYLLLKIQQSETFGWIRLCIYGVCRIEFLLLLVGHPFNNLK